MGGGDLNLKKSWHPLTLRNQERVWKEEQKAKEEEDKLKQLRKELEQERQLQELQDLQASAGLRKRAERVEWMYAGVPGAGAAEVSEQTEDYLLGKRKVDEILEKAENAGTRTLDGLAAASVPKTVSELISASNPNANTRKDLQSKIKSDPLLAIKMQEKHSLMRVMDNPMQLRRLKEQRGLLPKANGTSSNKDRKKKSKRRRKDSVDEKADEERSHYDFYDRVPKSRQKTSEKYERNRSRSPRRRRSPSPRPRKSSNPRNGRRRDQSPARLRYPGSDEEKHYRSSERSRHSCQEPFSRFPDRHSRHSRDLIHRRSRSPGMERASFEERYQIRRKPKSRHHRGRRRSASLSSSSDDEDDRQERMRRLEEMRIAGARHHEDKKRRAQEELERSIEEKEAALAPRNSNLVKDMREAGNLGEAIGRRQGAMLRD